MANDTLSPVGFERPFIKAAVPADMRYALACIAGKHDQQEADLVRTALCMGLLHLGWSEEKIIKEYAEYRVRCLKTGATNEYGKE